MAESGSDEHAVVAVRALSMHPSSSFAYNEKRICTRVCLFMKMGGFAFYMAGATTCASRNATFITTATFIAYCFMLAGMFASICNLTRHEYALYKKYGTMFNSINEFKAWKIQQMPNLKYLFDVIELVIKLCFFMAAWPLTFSMHDDYGTFSMCELSMTVFKIHVILLCIVYLLVIFAGACLYIKFHSFYSAYTHARSTPDAHIVHPIESFYFIDDQTECCICLDKNAESWTMTRCAHSFHSKCISNWTQTNVSCPVCRTRLDQNQDQNQDQN